MACKYHNLCELKETKSTSYQIDSIYLYRNGSYGVGRKKWNLEPAKIEPASLLLEIGFKRLAVRYLLICFFSNHLLHGTWKFFRWYTD